jgi:uncharacterized membrane protein
MKDRRKRRVTVRYQWDRLKVSFWFAPLVMSLLAILLAWAMYRVDMRVPNQYLDQSRFILAGTPGELRSMLMSMATTTLATAGVVFTLLTLPLSTVAAQYGSRLLRLFLGDRTTQLVLGMFAATFVYCLAAALSIPPFEVEQEAPQIMATTGLLLMLGTFASLVLLVQHISTMLQAPNIAAAAGAQLREVVYAEMPEEVRGGGQADQEAAEVLAETDAYAVWVKAAGYIQFIDPETLLSLAVERNLVIRLLRKPGHFVQPGTAVALVWPAGRVDEELDRQIRRAFQIGNGRTPTQDIAYAFNQLVEMAVRAMSPAINDPFTAMTCLDYIGEGLGLFIQQEEKSPYCYDRDNRLRLILEPVTFAELFSSAFDLLRHCSSDNASVLLHMLDVIDAVGQEAGSPRVNQELLRHVGFIQAESQAGALVDTDRARIHQRCAELAELIQSKVT